MRQPQSKFNDVAALTAATEQIKAEMLKGRKFSSQECVQIISKGMDVAEMVRAYFPGSVGSSKILEVVKEVMDARGYTPENTLYAQSVCPDEINHEEGDITNLLTEHMGEVFHLGGLGGIPFTGKTGMGAYSHHVPTDGHRWILMAPHIGISQDLEFGKYSREGQDSAGTACGAAVGAYHACCKGHVHSTDPFDLQMSFICQEINKRKDKIDEVADDEAAKQVEIVKQMYDISKTMMENIISVDFGSEKSTLVLLTGIQINMPDPFEDYFQPLSFDVYKKDGSVEDLMCVFQGGEVPLPTPPPPVFVDEPSETTSYTSALIASERSDKSKSGNGQLIAYPPRTIRSKVLVGPNSFRATARAIRRKQRMAMMRESVKNFLCRPIISAP